MNSLVPNPPPTALRLQPQTQTTLLSAPTAFEVSSKEDREQLLSFFDIGITTGTDKVLGKINLPLCMKDGTTQCATNAEREECKWCLIDDVYTTVGGMYYKICFLSFTHHC